MSSRVHISSNFAYYGIMKIFLLSSLLFFSFLACSPVNPQKTVTAVHKIWNKGEHKDACAKLDTINPKKISKWEGETIFTYIRLYSLCSHKMGRKPSLKTSTIPSPYKEYYLAMGSVGVAKSLSRAISHLSSTLGKYPKVSEIHYRLGLFYLMEEKFSLACPLIKKALELNDSNNVSFRISYARCLLGAGKLNKIPEILAHMVRAGVKKRQFLQGRRILGRARMFKRLMPKDIINAVGVVRGHLKEGNGGKALDAMGDYLKLNPQFPLLHYLLAIINLRLGNTSDAVVELQRSLKLDGTDPDSWFLLGKLYMKTPLFLKSERFFISAKKYDPLNIKIRSKLREFYVKIERFKKAVEMQESIIHLNGLKKSLNEVYTLAKLQESAKQWDDSLTTYKLVVEKLGIEAGVKALKALGRIHLLLSQDRVEKTVFHRKKARKYVKEALKINPTDPQIMIMAKKLGIKEEKGTSQFDDEVKVKGAKHLNRKDLLFE
jgi:tetratricopeptide (TPR) repeat protein